MINNDFAFNNGQKTRPLYIDLINTFTPYFLMSQSTFPTHRKVRIE